MIAAGDRRGSNVRPRILVTVPIEHLEGTRSILESAGDVSYRKYPSREELLQDLPGVHALYPNARTRLDASLLGGNFFRKSAS